MGGPVASWLFLLFRGPPSQTAHADTELKVHHTPSPLCHGCPLATQSPGAPEKVKRPPSAPGVSRHCPLGLGFWGPEHMKPGLGETHSSRHFPYTGVMARGEPEGSLGCSASQTLMCIAVNC